MVTVLPAATREKRVSGLHGQQDLVVANVIICDFKRKDENENVFLPYSE